jgi:hypothetical protein
MRRREFTRLLGGAAAAWPLAAQAQQPAMPVIGLLDSRSPEALTDRLRGFRQGLKDTGYVEGENVAIEYRWAENQLDRLQVLAAELVRRRVVVIATSGGPAVPFAAKAATRRSPSSSPSPTTRSGLVLWLARERILSKNIIIEHRPPPSPRWRAVLGKAANIKIPVVMVNVRDLKANRNS